MGYGYGYDPTALIVTVIVAGLLAFIPAAIAKRKGASGVGFWFFGFFFWLIALIVALVMKDRNIQQQPQVVVVQPPPQPVQVVQQPVRQAAPPPPRPAPRLRKKCLYCGSSMDADADVCAACGARATD